MSQRPLAAMSLSQRCLSFWNKKQEAQEDLSHAGHEFRNVYLLTPWADAERALLTKRKYLCNWTYPQIHKRKQYFDW